MSFNATCSCPNCKAFWYEHANPDKTYSCPICGYRDIEPEELDAEKENALINYIKKITKS